MDPILPKRHLGPTDLEVSPIGLGVMQFSGTNGMFRFMFEDLAQSQMNSIVQTALDGGVNWFDTAEMYGRGHSERALANALKAAGKSDSEILIGTKWMPLFRTAANIRKTIATRQHFLDGYSIDLYMIHQPWSFSPPEAEMEAMADLMEAGKIHAVGVSNFDAEKMRRAHAALERRGIPLAVNQVQYSLAHRDIETNGVLAAARELGVTIVAWGPLASGLLTGKFHRDPSYLARTPVGRRMRLRRAIERSRNVITTLEQLAEKHGVSPAQVALNWVVNAQGDDVVAIPGASKVKHAEESAGAMGFQLDDEEITQLNQVSSGFH